MACSWNTELLEKVAGVIGKEANALGTNNVFAPVLDLSRELRWGRVEENVGRRGKLISFFADCSYLAVRVRILLLGRPRRADGLRCTARTRSLCGHLDCFQLQKLIKKVHSQTGAMGLAFVTGIQGKPRASAGKFATAQVAAMCKYACAPVTHKKGSQSTIADTSLRTDRRRAV